MSKTLSGSQLRTYHSIFSHPIARNLEWRDVHSMFNALGEVVEEHNGNARITLHGHVLVLPQLSPNSMTDPSALMKIRHFLRLHEDEEGAAREGDHLLVVIDHQEARIFKTELHGAVPEKVVPHDPHGFGRHLHNLHDTAKGQHHPIPKSFFEDVAKTLKGAGQILIFGTAKGGGSAMNELVDFLHTHDKELFERVIGAQIVDESHLSEDQLLAMAREFYGVASGVPA